MEEIELLPDYFVIGQLSLNRTLLGLIPWVRPPSPHNSAAQFKGLKPPCYRVFVNHSRELTLPEVNSVIHKFTPVPQGCFIILA